MILLTADMKELKANPDRAAKGTVIEAKTGQGHAALWPPCWCRTAPCTPGDIIVAGTTVGRVRAMMDDKGRKAESSRPLCAGGDHRPGRRARRAATSSTRCPTSSLARELVEQRDQRAARKSSSTPRQKVTLDNLFEPDEGRAT